MTAAVFIQRTLGVKLPKSRCKNKCENEASIQGSGNGRYNAKCRYCEIALNTNDLRCYCCKQKLSRRKSVTQNLKHKEPLIVRI